MTDFSISANLSTVGIVEILSESLEEIQQEITAGYKSVKSV